MLALGLLAAAQSPAARAREAGQHHVASSNGPARDTRSPERSRDDPTCQGLTAREIAALREIPEIDTDELCRSAAEATKNAHDDASFPYPLWLVVVVAVVAIAFSAVILWYSIAYDAEVPRPWRWW